MTDYTNKLVLLSEKMKKLQEEETKLLSKRKQEIGALAERFGLLTCSDEMILGLFSDASSHLNQKSPQLKS